MIGSISTFTGAGVPAAQTGPQAPAAGNWPKATPVANRRDARASGNTIRYGYRRTDTTETPAHSMRHPLRAHVPRRLARSNHGDAVTATAAETSAMTSAVIAAIPAPTSAPGAADIDRLLLLRPGDRHAADRKTLNAVLDYANICNLRATTGENAALSDWWARLRDYAPQYAKDDLARIGHNLRQVFFETPPQQRAAEWQRLSASAKRDLNLMLDLGEVLRNADRPYVGTAYDASLPALAQVMEQADAPDPGLRETDTPYLLSLAHALRERNATGDAYFRNRVEIMPSDALSFVNAEMPDREEATPIDRAYRMQREKDLCALLYRALRHRCATATVNPLTLPALREGIEGALLAEQQDQAYLRDMFANDGRPEAIFHDGWVLRNARGKTPSDLVAYLDAHGPPELRSLHHTYKLSLVRRKLYQLGEYAGDYKFGSIMRAMATVLMRTASLPASNRHVVYATALEMEEHWVGRIQQEIEQGNMPYMLEIVEAVYNERANGVEEWNTQAYRAQYGKLLQAIAAAVAGYGCDARDKAAIWRWLARHLPGWRADTRQFEEAMSIGEYAAIIENVVDMFYRIAQAREFPRFVTTDILTAMGGIEFHPLLEGLPERAGCALSDASRKFDYDAFRTEHTVSDKQNPAYTLIQKMENTFYRNTFEMRSAPFWSVETEAYRLLLASNLTAEQITDGHASIYSNVHEGKHFQRVRNDVHAAFVAVIRNVDADALLLLPNGKSIKPYRLIKQSYDAFHAALEKHPWVVGNARQQIRDTGLPFLPSVLKAEGRRIAKMLSVAAITTESGTEAADELLSFLPIFAPTLQLARALRDDRSHKLYYVLLIARDVLATAAMGKMIFAAYVTPFIMGMRLGASAVLAARMIPGKTMSSVRRLSYGVRRLSITQKGYTDFDTPRGRKPQKQSDKHDIPIFSDQAQPGGLRRRTNQARSGGNAARRISEEQKMNNGTLVNPDGVSIHPDIWLQLMTLIEPTLLQNARQFHAMLRISGQSQAVVFNMTYGNSIENAGARAGLKGLTGADAFTFCETQALQDRQTVQDAIAWQVKLLDDNAHDGKPLRDHLLVEIADDAKAVWRVHPDWRYDSLRIVEQAYALSISLRQLFNLYDSRPVNPLSIHLEINARCTFPLLTLRGPTSKIVLPADPNCLPFTINTRHVARQTVASAVIESVVAAIVHKVMRDDPSPRRPTYERGLCVWLANRILLQSDPLADPRVSAAGFEDRETAQRIGVRPIREAAELEDQYLERVNSEDPIAVRQHRFPAIANHPTAKAVTALAARIGLPAYLRSLYAPEDDRPEIDEEADGDFADRFRHRFAIDIGQRNPADSDRFIATAHQFFNECYAKSPLFHRLFDHGLQRRDQQWIIFPDGYAGDDGIEHDMLIPSQGIINAAAENALYLGLIDVQPSLSNASIALPTSSLRPLEPFRRMLDGVIAALGGEHMLLPREAAFGHRGAVAWASDMVLHEAMQDAGKLPNKRLAQIAISADNADDCKRLRKMAAQRREQARDEDAYLDHWFATVNNIASP